jgi:pimeloyl-ACP methyl ester carboxylesterase
LSEAIESIVEYLEETGSEDAILVGHSYGGTVITAWPIAFYAGSGA